MLRRVFIVFLLVAFVGGAPPLAAADRDRVRALNVAIQPAFTLVSAAIQGKLKTRRDWLKCLGSGAVAGYGFYEAKARAGDGDVRTAWLIANASASLSANAAAGRHPLSRMRITVGPLRAEVATPLEKDPSARIHLGGSLYEVAALVRMWDRNDRIKIRDGLIGFESDERYENDDGTFEGLADGTFPGYWKGAPEIWSHEVVHAIQAVQLDSVEPPLCSWLRRCRESKPYRFVRVDLLDVGAMQFANDYALSQEEYVDRWNEIEAYRVDVDRPPPRPRR